MLSYEKSLLDKIDFCHVIRLMKKAGCLHKSVRFGIKVGSAERDLLSLLSG